MPVLTKINTNAIADDAVTAAKIPAGAVDSDIGVGSVTASHIAANAVGSSEIADDAVLPANIAYLGDGSGNLSGTITTEQLRFGTVFTLDDDLTINGDVTLGKVGDDSTGQTLTHTASTARTITGTGTLRMGSSMSSVSGMTGALGSAVTIPAAGITGVLPVGVTGGTGLTALGTVTSANLANTAIVYPAGHVLQIQHHQNITATSVVDSNAVILTKTFNRIVGNSHFVCTTLLSLAPYTNDANQDAADPRLKWVVNGSDVVTIDRLSSDGFFAADCPAWHSSSTHNGRYDIYTYQCSEDFTHISSGTAGDSVTIAVNASAGTKGMYVNRGQGATSDGASTSLLIMEIQ